MAQDGSLLRRSISGVVDVYVAILLTIGLGLLTGLTDPILSPSSSTSSREISDAYFNFFWATIFVLVFCGAAFETGLGVTPGKVITRLRAVDANGEAMTRGRALMRNISKLASIYVFGVGLLWVVFDRRRRSWHDLMAGTRVIDDR